MYLRPPEPGPARGAPRDSRIVVPTPDGPRHIGHAHFWERALSRRQLIRTAAGTTAAVLGSSLWLPAVASAAHPGDSAPKPIPGGIDLLEIIGVGHGPTFHVFGPAFGNEVSTVGDFNGFVAAADIQGTGTTNAGTTLTFDADMRFMDGVYVGVDGHTRRGTFGFV